MAYEESLKSVTFEADASIGVRTGYPGMPGSAAPNSGRQFRFVVLTSADHVGLAGAGVAADGVLQNKPQRVDDAATVGIFGISMVETGAAVAAIDPIAGDANGRAVKALNAAAVNGKAVRSASKAGVLIPVLLKLNA